MTAPTVSPSQFKVPDYAKFSDPSSDEIMNEMVNPVLDGDGGASSVADDGVTAVPPAPAAPKADQKPAPAPDGKKAPDAGTDGAFYQDESGKWHRPDGEFASADEAADAEAALTGDVAAPEPGKEGAVAAGETPKVLDYQPVKTQLTEFAVKASDGTPVSEFPELTFSFKAAGKELTDVPLDKVVKLAQMGVYNSQREADVTQYRQERETLGRQIRELQQSNEQWNQWYQRVLVDDGFRQAAQAQYAQENSPQALLARREYEIQQERQALESQRVFDQAAGYINTRIGPTVEAIQLANPHVTPQEVLGQFSMLTSAMLVNGVLPPDRLYDVMAIVEHELKPWAEQVHGQREEAKQATTAKQRRQITAAQIEAFKAKRSLAAATSPTGGAGIPGRTAASANGAAPRTGNASNPTVEDWMEDQFGIEKWSPGR